MKPPKNTEDFDRWERCDFMVMSWLTNSIVSEIADNFLHVTSAKALWDEITERFAESNRPLIFQLQKDLANIKQENMFVAMYYSKLKKVWDELQAIDALPLCECGAIEHCSCVLFKRLMDRESTLKVMQFLMGLSDAFENLRSNILSQEPLPTVNKTFHMALQVECQKGITMPSNVPHDVLAVNRQGNGGGNRSSPRGSTGATAGYGQNVSQGGNSVYDRRDYKRTKLDRKCDFCHEVGHFEEACFKLVGYPEWWKGPRPQGNASGKLMANVQDVNSFSNPLETDDLSFPYVKKPDATLINAVIQEVMKVFQGRLPTDDAGTSGHSFSGILNVFFRTIQLRR